MKSFYCFSFMVLSLLLPAGSMHAQDHHLRRNTMEQRMLPFDQLKADPQRAYGGDSPYHFSSTPLTEPPRGYTPFYISHYGRHGSRYHWSEDLYNNLDTLLTKAFQRQQLTTLGLALHHHFMELKQELMKGVSELTDLGWQQHQRIARTMYNDFSEVFRRGGNVMAVSSLSGRCMLSMSAFCQELVQCNPKIEIREQASRFTAHSVTPSEGNDSLHRQFPDAKARFESHWGEFESQNALMPVVVDRVFSSIDSIGTVNHVYDLLAALYTSLPNIGHEGMMEGIISDEELTERWETTNLGSYAWVFSRCYKVTPILEDIIAKADAVISGQSDLLANLRFGHDSYLGPLTVLMGINGADRNPEDPYEVKYSYQNWETCMASNIQLVFYHSKKEPKDILVKCLLNGEEATLPVPTQQAPYYKWADFRQFYLDRIERTQI